MSRTVEPAPEPTTHHHHADADEQRLHQLGYAQELRRRLSGFSNFAVSFSIISILAGCITSYAIAMNAGGPFAITVGWPFVGMMVIAVSLSMAEIASTYPTAGALYWWSAALAKRNKAAWAWFTGWFNFLGEVAVTSAIDFGAATTTSAFLNLSFGMEVTKGRVFLVFLVILLLHGLLNTFGVTLVGIFNNISVWWHVIGVAIIVGALALIPDRHQGFEETFTGFVNNTGWSSGLYAFAIGLLMAQYTFTGYDASAHMAEETKNASVAAPRGVVMSVLVSLIAGWILLIGITAAIQDYDSALATETGLPPAQIFIDAIGHTGGTFLLFIVVVAQFFCGMASVTANSRMTWAFARDGAFPASRIWAKVNPRTGTPTNSIWLAVSCSLVLSLPALWNTTAYLAVTSIAVIGLYIAYVTPVFLRLRAGDEFQRGPWHLGALSKPIGWVAVSWVGLITVLFVLPPANPVTWQTFNYSAVAVVAVLLFAGTWWLLSARKWFTGPRRQGTEEELERIEEELELLAEE